MWTNLKLRRSSASDSCPQFVKGRQSAECSPPPTPSVTRPSPRQLLSIPPFPRSLLHSFLPCFHFPALPLPTLSPQSPFPSALPLPPLQVLLPLRFLLFLRLSASSPTSHYSFLPLLSCVLPSLFLIHPLPLHFCLFCHLPVCPPSFLSLSLPSYSSSPHSSKLDKTLLKRIAAIGSLSGSQHR